MPPLPTPLPTTRTLLTSLITSITQIPLHHDSPPPIKPDDTTSSSSSSSENTKQRKKRLKSRRLEQREDGTNVLKRVPATHRHLIITLHVLFPGLVLPALDLLDRGLVGRVVLRGEGRGPTKDEADGGVKMEGGLGEGLGNHIPDTETTDMIVKMEDDESTARTTAAVDGKKEEDNPKPKPAPQQPSPAFYLVRSAQPSSRHRGRRRGGGHGSGGEGEEDVNGNNLFPGGQRGYIVRLDAWNCTCAAFAFAAFPVEGDGDGDGEEESKADVGGDATGVEDGRMDVDVGLDVASHPDINEIAAGRHDDGEQWKFGGMSLENSGSASAPLCKHLLACLLAERWERALGQYVVERHVSKAEMAGIVAEI